jgi:tetratricopeptide (TPR) repeat protein
MDIQTLIKRTSLVLFLFALPFLSVYSEGDDKIAEFYFKGASELAEKGDVPGALQLLNIAFEYNTEDSDTYYLKAELLFREQQSTAAGIQLLHSALDHNNWNTYTDWECRLTLAEVYLRTRQYQSGLDTLLGISQKIVRSNPDYYYLFAAIYRNLENYPEYRDYLTKGRSLFPDNPRLQRLAFENKIPAYEEKVWLENWEKPDKEYLRYLLDYLLRCVQHQIVDKEFLVEKADEYRQKKGDDPLIYLVDLYTGAEAADVTEDVFKTYPEDLFAVRNIMNELQDEEHKQQLIERYRNYSGVLTSDKDRNGYWEEELTVENGSILAYRKDADQNGITEITVHINGQPEAVEIQDGGVRFTYRKYPEIGTVICRPGNPYGITVPADNEISYHLRPDSLYYSLYPVSGPAHQLEDYMQERIIPYTPVIDEKSLMETAFRIQNASPGTQTVHWALDVREGTPIKMVQDTTGDGEWDKIVLYRSGNPAEGMRDPDEDGIYEVLELYSNGKIAVVMYDEDGDGNPEYIKQTRPNTQVLWDYNDDGTIDDREIMLGRNRILRELQGFNAIITRE